MTFNAALTGLRAANTELEVSGNNIANASTVGFKESRVEFADVYASANIGGGSNAIGNGVRVANVAQQFSQGSIGFTDNALDMAINGGGFFILDDQGSQIYTRSGQFGINTTGQIVSSEGALLQGFPANGSGVVSGVLDTLQINSSNITPRQTSEVNLGVNLDAESLVLATRGLTFTTLTGTDVGQVSVGTGDNGYQADTITIDGVNYTIPSSGLDGASAAQISNSLTAITGVNATAETTASFSIAGGGTSIGAGELLINSVAITGTTLNEIAQAITGINTDISASVTGSTISIVDNSGGDLNFDVLAGANLDISGAAVGTTTVTPGNTAIVGGVVTTNVDEGLTLDSAAGSGSVFPQPLATTNFVLNDFDPGDENTFNDVTSATIFDSLGAPHVMTTYFVKESQTTNPPNTWSVYVQIDGRDVGDPDPLSVNPTAATRASFQITFNQDGSYNQLLSDEIVVTNWQPLDASGADNGALGPDNGGTLPVPFPATSSNFFLDLDTSTQNAGVFSVNSLDQTGYSTGQLSGLDIDESGIIFARYSNGEALVLGQVALGDFSNEQGLTPIGDTSWAESFQSGPAVIGAPLSASLGAVQSGALEDSNVELAEELVSLIIAQRNFQANARTIETANEVTQTIINLR